MPAPQSVVVKYRPQALAAFDRLPPPVVGAMKGLPDFLRKGEVDVITEVDGVEELDCGEDRHLFVYGIEFQDVIFHFGFEIGPRDGGTGLIWLGWTAAKTVKAVFRGRLRLAAGC